MPKLFLFYLNIFYFNSLVEGGGGLLFEWIPSNQLTKTEYWLNKNNNNNCDKKITENKNNNSSFVGILNGEIKVNNLLLPENGIIFFGKNAKIVEKYEKQCLEESFNNPKIDFIPNFYDVANWKIKNPKSANREKENEKNNDKINEKEERSSTLSNIFLLDAEKVPSKEDDVLFPKENASKIFLNVQTIIRSFNFSGNLLSNEQLKHFPYTLEGQFQLIFGNRISSKIKYTKYNNSLQINLPIGLPLKINKHKNDRKLFFGYPNSNFFEPQFSALCEFVNCQKYSYYCSNPIKPVGQCCEQCGALLSFRQNNLNYTKSLEIINNYNKLINNFKLLPKYSGISFVRIDNDNFNYLYQISILNKYQFNFNEEQFYSVLWNIFKKIQKEVNDHHSIKYSKSSDENLQFYFDLKIKYSRQVGIIHFKELLPWLFLTIIIGIILILAFYSEYKRNPRLRLFIADIIRNEHLNNINVKWRRKRSTTDEHVEIPVIWTDINVNSQKIKKQSSVSEFVNKAFIKSNIEDIDDENKEL